MSKEHFNGPLQIDFVQSPVGGSIGLTHCPGRQSLDAQGRQWSRDLVQDITSLKRHGTSVLVSLLSHQELQHHGVSNLETHLRSTEIEWLQFPIIDFGVPNTEVRKHWEESLPRLLQYLHMGKQLVIHCAAGYGRTGMMAASLLVAMGVDSDEAIARVRAARPGSIETPEQEAFVRQLDEL